MGPSRIASYFLLVFLIAITFASFTFAGADETETCSADDETCIVDKVELTESELLHGADIGVLQVITASTEGENIKANIAEAREYLSTVEIDQGLKDMCKNKHEYCAFWATIGECESKLCGST
jgi:hypothetical protein